MNPEPSTIPSAPIRLTRGRSLPRLKRVVRLGVKSLWLHKLRSMLTVLGIVFGVCSVIAMLAIGEGASYEAQEAIKKLITNWPATDYVGESASFDEAHKRALQLKTYTPQEIQAGAKSGQWATLNKQSGAGLYSPGEGTFPTRASGPPSPVSLESVQPSQKLKTTDLGPLKISHPENWPVTLPEQKGQFVTIAHQAGVTNRGVGYGVLLNGVPGPQGQRMSIDDMTVQLIKQIQQSNELEQLGDPQPLIVGGVEGRSTFLRSSLSAGISRPPSASTTRRPVSAGIQLAASRPATNTASLGVPSRMNWAYATTLGRRRCRESAK